MPHRSARLSAFILRPSRLQYVVGEDPPLGSPGGTLKSARAGRWPDACIPRIRGEARATLVALIVKLNGDESPGASPSP